MKKNYIFKTLLFLIPLSAFVLVSFSTGVNGARTGSPGDSGGTCTACHAPGADFGASALITTDIPAAGYELNTAYNITVTATSSAPNHGFQITSERVSDNAKVGNFTGAGGTVAQDGGTRLSHSSPGNTWTFTWTSPSSAEGDVKFYAALNAVNSNGSTSGDQVVTTSSSNLPVLSIADAKRLDFEMYPNPSNNFVNVQLPSGVNNAKVTLYDYTGRTVKSQKVSTANKEVDIQDLSSGVYILKVETDSKIGTQQLVKE